MMQLVREVKRAIERSTITGCKVAKYDLEQGKTIGKPGDVQLDPAQRFSEALSVLRSVDRLPPYEHAVVYGLAGDPAMREGAILVLLDVVDRDRLGDGPAKEAIRYYLQGRAMSKRKLSKEYGGSPTTHLNYRNFVADELDRLLYRAVDMCRASQ